MMKLTDNYEIEVIITIAIVMGGTLIAHKWHLSSPLAMVTAGLLVGNDKLRQAAMSKETEGYVDKFWELIDVLFNIILFVLIDGNLSFNFQTRLHFSRINCSTIYSYLLLLIFMVPHKNFC